MLALLFLSLALGSKGLRAQDEAEAAWPREFNSSQGKVVLYQPQPQKLEGNKVTGVSAFSLLPTGKTEPVFGALFFEARLNLDRDSRAYAMESLAIPNIKFSGEQKDLDPEKVKAALIQEAKGWKIQGSMDQLTTTIEANAEELSKVKQNFKNDPPRIITVSKPTVLILIDGDPKLKDIQNTQLQHVANSPYTIFLNKADRQYYLYGGEIYYTASSMNGPWKVTKNVPKDIKKLLDQNKDAAKNAAKVEITSKDTIPDVVVSTVPAELIVSNGPPEFKDIDSTSLQYVSNSDDNGFRDKTTQQYWILKSGRWYTSASLNGPWKFVPAENIPKDFGNIPRGTEKDNVLASVPGTIEARDALLDAQLPQTATVDRATAGKDEKVQYDGKPVYEHIEGTTLDLVKNSDKTVFRTTVLPTTAGSSKQFADKPVYYMVDNGVWYKSFAPDGPWQVSDTRPPDVDNIPPSSSAYNTKYVYVYDQTPSTVYVGYTPGYMGSYIYGPTVVYGTGFYYNPWYGSYYYPHHSTWGFNMGYNPWTGWSIGFGFSTGPFHFGFGTGGFTFGMSWGYGGPMWGYPGYGGGWFGPPMYRPPCYGPHYPYYGYNRPGYGGYRPGYGGGYNPGYGGGRPNNIGGSNNGNVNWGGGNQINIGGDVNINVGNGSGNNLYNRPGGNGGGRPGISSGINGNDVSNINMGNRPGKQPSTRPTGNTGNNRPGNNNVNSGNNRPGNNNVNPGNRLPDNNAGNNRPGNNNVNPGNRLPDNNAGNNRPGNNNVNPGNRLPDNNAGNNRPGNNNLNPNNRLPESNGRPNPTRPANDVFADRDGNVYQKDKVNGGFNQNSGGNNWNRPTNNNPSFNNGGFNNGGNSRPAPDYNRDRGNNKAGQINRQPPSNNFGGGARPAPSARPAPAPAARPTGRGRGN